MLETKKSRELVHILTVPCFNLSNNSFSTAVSSCAAIRAFSWKDINIKCHIYPEYLDIFTRCSQLSLSQTPMGWNFWFEITDLSEKLLKYIWKRN